MIREIDDEKPKPPPPHEDNCGEHPPFLVANQNKLTGLIEPIVVRARCERSCSRFCIVCDVCKYKCGHINNHKSMIDSL